MLLQKAPQRFRRCNFSLDVNIKQEKMNDNTIFVSVRLPSGAVRRLRVPKQIAEMANQLQKENPDLDDTDALHEAKLRLENSRAMDSQQ